MNTEARLNRIWYGRQNPAWWMRPLAVVFHGAIRLRKLLYRFGVLRRTRMRVPVIVIGNITLGGTGKTPFAIYLVEQFRKHGLSAGLVSRGYGGDVGPDPVTVNAHTSPEQVGDEPVLLAERTKAPVVVHPRRARAATALLEAHAVDLIICDDGLQHYALARDIEIAVVDAERGLGNARLLPAGPLREPATRLASVDYVISNGGNREESEFANSLTLMRLQPTALVNLLTGERRPAASLIDERCTAIAGIGNPQRFFGTLSELGYSAECRAFPDHHPFGIDDLSFAATRPVLMTEKDAVKCRGFARPNWWFLEISAVLEDDIAADIIERLNLTSRRERE